MNNLNFKIKSKALSDIETIAEFIARDKKSAATKMLNTFYKTFMLLAQNPQIGSKREDFTYKDVRFYVVKKYYLVVYRIESESIEIVRVLTVYQDICNKL